MPVLVFCSISAAFCGSYLLFIVANIVEPEAFAFWTKELEHRALSTSQKTTCNKSHTMNWTMEEKASRHKSSMNSYTYKIVVPARTCLGACSWEQGRKKEQVWWIKHKSYSEIRNLSWCYSILFIIVIWFYAHLFVGNHWTSEEISFFSLITRKSVEARRLIKP